jgi:replicative DNA helicase
MSEHEQAVLGVILREAPELYDTLGLVETDFAEAVQRAVWRAIGVCLEAGLRPDLLTVGERCNGAAAKVAELTSMGLRANVEYHAERIRETAKEERVRRAIPRLQDAAKEGVVAFADELDAIGRELVGEETRTPRELWKVLIDTHKILEARADAPRGVVGESCGFRSVDYWTKGLQAGDLIVLAARTSVGKTALALSMARRMHCPVGYISIEMSATQIAERLIQMEGRVSTLSIRREQLGGLVDVCEKVGKRAFYLDDTPVMTLATVRQRCRWMTRRGARVIFIDYLTLIKTEKGDTASRAERVGRIVKELKQLARELSVPIVALAQINRLAEGVMPGLENLGQSGEIEEDADVVLLMHRERGSEEAELRIAKNRRGPVGDVELRYLADFTLFEEIEHGAG